MELEALSHLIERHVTDEGGHHGDDEIIRREDVSQRLQERSVSQAMAQIILAHQEVRIEEKDDESHLQQRSA
jgi:uncharacterized protein YheU (UPF0270 family)